MNFHLDFYNPTNWFNVIGGIPTITIGVFGALFSYNYYASQSRIYNYYANITRSIGRLGFGFSAGLAIGIWKFGDRQRLHNAWVAERLIRRYPESMTLSEHDLYRCKGIKAPHAFYRWI